MGKRRETFMSREFKRLLLWAFVALAAGWTGGLAFATAYLSRGWPVDSKELVRAKLEGYHEGLEDCQKRAEQGGKGRKKPSEMGFTG
jgi:hypothetical protein